MSQLVPRADNDRTWVQKLLLNMLTLETQKNQNRIIALVEGKRIKNDKKGGRGRMPVAVIAGNTIAAKPVPALSTQNLFLTA